MIEEGRAAVQPAANFAHLPDTMALVDYDSKPLVSVDAGFVIAVQRKPDGMPVVRFVNLDGSVAGSFFLGAKQAMATAAAGFYDIDETAFANCPANGQPRIGTQNRDGRALGFSWSCGGNRRGKGKHQYSDALEADGPGRKATFFSMPDGGQLQTSTHHYLPMTDALLAEAAEKLRIRAEEERRLAAERQRQRELERAAAEERSARRWETVGIVMQGLSQGTAEALAEQQRQQAEHDAVMEGIRSQAMAVQEQQRQAEERALQQRQAPAPVHTGPMVAPVSQSPQPPSAERTTSQPKPQPRTPVVSTPKAPAPAPAGIGGSTTPASQCKVVTRRFTSRSLPMDTREAAENGTRHGSTCMSGPATRESLTCSTDEDPVMKNDKDGIPRIVGRRTFHICEATYSCPQEVCESKPAGGSRQ